MKKSEETIIGILNGERVALRLHKAMDGVPRTQSEAEAEIMRNSIRESGVFTPLLVKPAKSESADKLKVWDIVEGRDRFTAVRALIAEGVDVEPVPCHETALEAEDVIVRSLNERRHQSKSTRAYLIWPLVSAQVEVNKKARGAAAGTKTDKIGFRSLDTMAAEYGFSADLFDQARRVHELFAKRRDLKELYEPEILTGDASLGGILAGQAGREATKDKKRQDRPTLALIQRGLKDLRVRWDAKLWKKMPEADREQAITDLVECVQGLPEDVRSRLASNIA